MIDASTTLSWHFPDERSAETDAVMAKLQSDEALVPGLWWFEVRNALLIGERRGRTDLEKIAAFLEFLSEFRISVALLPDWIAVMALARRHRLSFYDAAYLELALRENHALATVDRDLRNAARAEGVALA